MTVMGRRLIELGVTEEAVRRLLVVELPLEERLLVFVEGVLANNQRGAVEAEREWCRQILDVDQRDAGDGRLLATLANMAAVRLRELGGR